MNVVVKGWCPGALRPMESGDGLLVRVKPWCGALSLDQAAGVAEIARKYDARVAVAEVPPLTAAQDIRVPFASAQAHVLIGQPGHKRQDPDYFALLLGNHILGGGGQQSRLFSEVRERRFTAAGVDSRQVRALSQPVPLQRLGLAEQKATGEVVQAKRENRVATMLVPIGGMVLLYLVVMSSAPALLNTVLEEKMQKISEVLLASVSPFELMLGKLLGTVLVSLTLSGLYMGSLVWGLWRFGQLENVPGQLYAWFFLFQVLALLMYGSVFLAIGAACNEIRDAQSLMMPVMMVGVRVRVGGHGVIPRFQAFISGFSACAALPRGW